MKPKTRAKLEQIPAVKLYREDLESILSLFHTYCAAVTISDARFEYESLDELKKEVGSRVKNLEIVGTKPSISLALISPGSTLRHVSEGAVLTSQEADSADLLFARVKEFLFSRKRVIARILSIPVILISVLVLVVSGVWGVRRYPEELQKNILVTIMFVSVFLIVGFGMAVLNGAFRFISLESKANASSFWSRNRDDLLKLALGSGLGVGGTLIVQWLSRHIK